MFEKHFKSSVPTVLAKTLFETKDKKKNDVLVNVISSGLKDLKEEITDMSKGEKKIAKTDDIVKVTNYFSSIKSRKQFWKTLKWNLAIIVFFVQIKKNDKTTS